MALLLCLGSELRASEPTQPKTESNGNSISFHYQPVATTHRITLTHQSPPSIVSLSRTAAPLIKVTIDFVTGRLTARGGSCRAATVLPLISMLFLSEWHFLLQRDCFFCTVLATSPASPFPFGSDTLIKSCIFHSLLERWRAAQFNTWGLRKVTTVFVPVSDGSAAQHNARQRETFLRNDP